MRVHPLFLAAAAAVSVFATHRTASACGGCFAPTPIGNEIPPVVTAHRMALSISTEQTVLWDQIQYSGAPSEFAWVLPVKPGARVEVASDAWFDVLDAATSPIVIPPEVECDEGASSCTIGATAASGCGDGASAGDGGIITGPSDGVDIVKHGSAGPYEMVILSSEDPEALTTWLADNEYQVAEDIEPVIAQYVQEGFDFVALKLAPGAGIRQMRPVRVVMDGAVPVLPLRMVAAGSGARTAISLFVIGEGRYTAGNFIEGRLPERLLTWDFANGLTNYAELRDAVFEQNAQQTFLVPYAMRGALFREMRNPVNDLPVVYRTTGSSSGYVKMAEAFVQQAFQNGETSSTDCAANFHLAADLRRVVDPCGEDGACRSVDDATEIDRRVLECAPPIGSDYPLDDLAVALTGLHPRSVWVTRLDANLGRSAFGRDLELIAAGAQVERPSFVQAQLADNTWCEQVAVATKPSGNRPPREMARLGIAGALLAVLMGAILRRLSRIARASKRPGTEVAA